MNREYIQFDPGTGKAHSWVTVDTPANAPAKLPETPTTIEVTGRTEVPDFRQAVIDGNLFYNGTSFTTKTGSVLPTGSKPLPLPTSLDPVAKSKNLGG